MIGIIDYGMSNLYSVKNACDYLGLDCVVSKDVSILSKCDKLILPGVGAFQDCMDVVLTTSLSILEMDKLFMETTKVRL